MKKSPIMHGLRITVALFISLSILPMLIQAQDKGTFKDARDGHVYNWVKIGTQVWMTTNMKFNVPAESWAYNNDSATEAHYGKLYSWKGAQASCPKGWHLPSDKEWTTAIQSLGGANGAGTRLQSMDTVTNAPVAAGSAVPGHISSLLGGVRHPDGSCIGINSWGGCWTSAKVNDTVATNVLFAHGSKEIGISTNDKKSGFSVRCVRNK
ncbi:MAG: hypothetical protein NT040_12930 [Bacteroidetes bacterium]|nr:hypothetical protein [Bacteroidota bacterium]